MRKSLNAMKSFGAIVALVDARAGTGIDSQRHLRIDDDTEDVGIIQDSLLEVMPVHPSVAGFPRQVSRPGIDDVGILRIDGDGDKIPQRGVVLDRSLVLRRSTIPGRPAVAGLVGSKTMWSNT